MTGGSAARARPWMRVARPGPDGRIRINARQIFILPTPYGLTYALALFLMLIGSLNYGSNLGLLFTFLCVGVGMVAILHTWRNLVHLELVGEPAVPVFAGGEAAFTVRLVEGEGRVRPALALSPHHQREWPAPLMVAALGETGALLHRPAPARGELELGILRLATVYPLGLLRAWCYLDTGVSTLVYPRPAARAARPARPDYRRSEKGDRGVGADDFVGPRRYRPGDPPRHLDWKALARERGLVTRQFGGDRAEEVWLEWATLTGMEHEGRLSCLCRMVLDAAAADRYYGLRLPGQEIPPGQGDLHRHRCLAALARFPCRGQGT